MKQSTDWIDDNLARLDGNHLRRDPRSVSLDGNGYAIINGVRYVNFGSNDYLNLANDVQIANAVVEAIRVGGWGAGSSPLITGRTPAHEELERRLAEFKKTEAALLFTSGFAANVGVISSLAESGDTIFSDEKNHASIIDGCRLSKATKVLYPHGDIDQLRQWLSQSPVSGRKLIVTDSLFSMDGDFAPLDQLCALARTYDAMVIVDEAHATGVFGETGAGAAEEFSCNHEIDVQVGTLSKAFGSLGGFVAGSQKLIDWLFNAARSYVFSTSPPAAMCAAAIAALDVIRDEPNRRIELLNRSASLRATLKANDWDVGDGCSQIIPIRIGRPDVTMQWSGLLAEHGYLVPGIRPPTVPSGESLLRISLTYAHTEETLDRFVETLNSLRSAMRS